MRTNATISIPLFQPLANTFARYTNFVVVVVMLFGGAARQGLWSDAIVQLAALPLLIWAVFRLGAAELDRPAKYALFLACAFVLLPIVQLIPLPPALWTALPGRDQIASDYKAAGLALSWLPVSLNPVGTGRSLFSLLPATAIFLAMLSLDRRARRTLLSIMFVVALISIAIGFLQIVGGVPYFYAITNEGMAVGFFANGNHNATFFACAIPYVAAFTIEGYAYQSSRMRLPYLITLIALIIGLAIVGSRAGMGLGLVAGVLCVAMASRFDLRRNRRVLLVAIAGFLVAGVIAVQFAIAGWQKRGTEARGIVEDLRWPVAIVTLQAAQKYLPFGTGFGTFVPIYQMVAPPSDLREPYINHAHDDWLELSLEGGIPALACLTGFVVWFAIVTARAWRKRSDVPLDRNLARAGSIAIVLIMLHSFVDYPIRSVAIMTVFALSCGFLLSPKRDANSSDSDLVMRQ